MHLLGEFNPKNVHKYLGYYEISNDNDNMCMAIRKQKKRIACINDSNNINDRDKAKKELQEAFSSILPEKSSFEISGMRIEKLFGLAPIFIVLSIPCV